LPSLRRRHPAELPIEWENQTVIRTTLLKTGTSRLLLALAGLGIGTAAYADIPGHPSNGNGKPSAEVTNPYSPAYQHEYRHGVIPTLGVAESM
jgi:hypothetical protein